jgi:hypothetical protein
VVASVDTFTQIIHTEYVQQVHLYPPSTAPGRQTSYVCDQLLSLVPWSYQSLGSTYLLLLYNTGMVMVYLNVMEGPDVSPALSKRVGPWKFSWALPHCITIAACTAISTSICCRLEPHLRMNIPMKATNRLGLNSKMLPVWKVLKGFYRFKANGGSTVNIRYRNSRKYNSD